MSENKSKKSSSTAPLVATIVVALAAIALAVVAVVTLTKDNKNNIVLPGGSVVSTDFHPSDELVEECQYAAHDLVKNNYQIIRLFVTEGLPHYDEPYGNLPEDGIYTVNSTDYTSLSQIEELVKSVFVNSEAERILTNIDGNGLAVYKNREILADVVEDDVADESAEESDTSDETVSRPHYTTETVLGISADFKPDTEYSKDWSSCSIAVIPISENECQLTIYLGGYDSSAGSVDPDTVLETQMVKVDGEWKLSVFVY